MGFTKPDLPDFEPDTFLKKPLMERMRILATDWAENGFGAPRIGSVTEVPDGGRLWLVRRPSSG